MSDSRNGKLPMFEYGEFSRYKNEDGTTSCYRDMKFIGAFENSSIFCDLYATLTKEIVDLKYRVKAMQAEIEQLIEDNEKLRLELSRARAFLNILKNSKELNQRGEDG